MEIWMINVSSVVSNFPVLSAWQLSAERALITKTCVFRGIGIEDAFPGGSAKFLA